MQLQQPTAALPQPHRMIETASLLLSTPTTVTYQLKRWLGVAVENRIL